MSSATTGHTPLPWRLGTDGNVWSGETGGEQLAVVHHLGGEDSVKGQNGRLVVRAVNLHERLLAALKQAHSALVGSHAADDSVQGEARARAWAAIRLAEGPTP